MQKPIYKLDITKIEGEGDFPCPKCGTIISPDDETENVYTIVDIDFIDENNEFVKSMKIQCNKCKSLININGLDQLSTYDEGNTRIAISEPLPESKPNYNTQHTLTYDDKNIGDFTVQLAREEDVEAFKRLRKLRTGDPFKCTITINTHFEIEDLKEIAKAIRRKFKGLRENDIYVVENKNGQKNFIGRF